MDSKNTYSLYKKLIKELLERPIFSYPFYDKSDDELILDAKIRSEKGIEFGLFELGEFDSKSVFAGAGTINTKYFPLKSTFPNCERIVQIKLSSFVYPAYFISSFIDKKYTLTSTFDYELFADYNSVLNYAKKFYNNP